MIWVIEMNWTRAMELRELRNKSITKESGTHEELKQIQLSSGQKIDRDYRMRGKRI
jgi:hypothetical protein